MSAVRPRATAARFGRGAALALALMVACALGAALFPWSPGPDRVRAGAPAPWRLVAPRAVSFDSAQRTEQVRAEAAAAVLPVLVLDPGVRDQQLGELDRALVAIARLRADTALAASARESAIRAVPGALSAEAAQAFAGASAAEWDAMASEARASLGRVLSGTLRVEDLVAARGRASGYLSPLLTDGQRVALTELVAPLVVPTLVVDAARTEALREEARKSQPPVHVSHARGEVLVGAGQPLTAADIELLEQAGLWTRGVRATDVAASALLAVLAGAAVGGYLLVAQPAELAGARRRLLLVLLLALPALAARATFPLLLPDQARQFLVYALPFAVAPMMAAVLLGTGAAVLLTLLLAAVVAFVVAGLPFMQGDGAAALEALRAGLAVAASALGAVLVAGHAERTQRPLLGGAVAALGAAAALLVVCLIDADRRLLDLPWIAGATATAGLLTALLAAGALALARRPFGIITRVELMELTQLSHPLLRRLQDEAPGSFQHSIVVGNLAERAAERIGADALLVRLGAYYHDVGKLVAPPFFVENSGEESPHARLDPLQSTRVILRHVTAGVEIARREGLPPQVVAFIPQHHGTRLVTFFYRRAAEVDPDIDAELFRYPGPRPQSREAALVMLADGCEATVRASTDRSPERIREIVEGVIRERVEERQFDECDLSLRDLRAVADSYTSTLTAVYHPRVEYPAPSERELASRRAPLLPDERGETRPSAHSDGGREEPPASARWPLSRTGMGPPRPRPAAAGPVDEGDEEGP